MCLIIYKPSGVQSPDNKALENAFDHNGDGVGYMFAHDGRLEIRKGFFKFAKFLRSYRKTEKRFPASPFVIHFRMSTHGRRNPANCHPFNVWPGVGLAHNGILPITPGTGNEKSDTAIFADFMRQCSHPKVLATAEGVQSLANYIGKGNKLAFLNASGVATLVNESEGTWREGCWLSNTYSINPPFVYSGFADRWDEIDWASPYRNGIPQTRADEKLQDRVEELEWKIMDAETQGDKDKIRDLEHQLYLLSGNVVEPSIESEAP